MKRYLSLFFFILSVVVLFIGFSFDFRWNGIISWGAALICLVFAAFFTKYIPNKTKKS